MNHSRSTWLLGLLALLVIANVLYYLVSNWGLITVHAKEQPLRDIVRSIERQGHVSLVTNLDPDRKVNFHVTKVPVAEALETLAAVTDSRWSLLYVIAPTPARIKEGLDQITKPEPADAWKRVILPLPPFASVQGTEAIDPRGMRWNVATPPTANLQDYLDQGAQSADVAFYLPADWNPSVPQPPPSGTIQGVVKSLASTVNGKTQEIFFLSEMRRQGFRPPEGGDRRGGMWQNLDLNRIDERIQQQIALLPPDEQKEARDSYNARKAFFQSLANLSPEERREKMREFFQSPDNQDRMESRDARRTPEQRGQRNSRYVQGRAAARGY